MGMIDVKKHVEFSDKKYVSKLLYDSEDIRLVLFCLNAGQEVPAHTSDSRVVMTVVEGEGSFIVGDKTPAVKPGYIAVCEPNESHGMSAKTKMLVLAAIAPAPF